MVQILLLILIALTSNCMTSNSTRNVEFEKEAAKFCCGHGGIGTFIYDDEDFSLICKDGTSARGPTRAIRFFPSCPEGVL